MSLTKEPYLNLVSPTGLNQLVGARREAWTELQISQWLTCRLLAQAKEMASPRHLTYLHWHVFAFRAGAE